MQDRVSLEGQNDHQTSQGERGSPPSDLEAQNSVLATKNPLDFSGYKAKQSMQQGLRCKAQNRRQSSIQGSI